ncbi:hypothetical protein QVD17_18354 [Tagetes erecta]|uniref:Uncharacterized protein n=1 Tax=Tagetes erecta TaxID=13708 RepID=A0AAD8NNX2_TARER|nr:hypothetical protein QVD17_18354 [Tagetes erecta]
MRLKVIFTIFVTYKILLKIGTNISPFFSPFHRYYYKTHQALLIKKYSLTHIHPLSISHTHTHIFFPTSLSS